MKPSLALSTCWCSSRHSDGYAMLREIAELGFDAIELSHGIRISLVPGVLKALREGMVKVTSTHNFCPLPTGVVVPAPNFFQPSSPDRRELDQWVRHTRRSIDFAAQVGARAIVLHLGSIRFYWFNPLRRVRKFWREGPEAGFAADPAYRRALTAALAKVRKRKKRWWERAVAAVEEVLPYAAEKGVRLGFENRERFEELPLDEDFPAILSDFSMPQQVGYWHDTGHARLKENAGLLNHREHLEANAGHLLGFHLHDVDESGNDHQPVGLGVIDFSMVADFFRPEHILVLELSPRVSPLEVTRSREAIERAVRVKAR